MNTVLFEPSIAPFSRESLFSAMLPFLPFSPVRSLFFILYRHNLRYSVSIWTHEEFDRESLIRSGCLLKLPALLIPPCFPFVSFLCRLSLHRFDLLISLAIYILFIIRGDFPSFLYVVVLLCIGPLSPLSLPSIFTTVLIILITAFSFLRFIVQTPFICQSTASDSGVWHLFFLVPFYLHSYL